MVIRNWAAHYDFWQKLQGVQSNPGIEAGQSTSALYCCKTRQTRMVGCSKAATLGIQAAGTFQGVLARAIGKFLTKGRSLIGFWV